VFRHQVYLPTALASETTLRGWLGLYANYAHLININSLPMVVDIAPQTELATYTGLYYFASTSAAVLGPFIAGILIDALGKDYGVIFAIAAVMFAVAFLLMLGVRRGERAEQAVATASAE
jgi:MFS family permease